MSESYSPDAERAAPAWTANDSSFGARLALIRQRLGWGNVREAALVCGIPAQSWRAWERDGVMPQGSRYFGICAKIALASGCDYGWLVDLRPSGSSQPTVPRFQLKVAASNDQPDLSARQPAIMATVRSS